MIIDHMPAIRVQGFRRHRRIPSTSDDGIAMNPVETPRRRSYRSGTCAALRGGHAARCESGEASVCLPWFAAHM